MAKTLFCSKTVYFSMNFGSEIHQSRPVPKQLDILIGFDQMHKLIFRKPLPWGRNLQNTHILKLTIMVYLYMYVLHTYGLYSSVGFTVVTADLKLRGGGLGWYPGSIPSVSIYFEIIGLYKNLFIFFLNRIVHFIFYSELLPLMRVCFSNWKHFWTSIY